MTIEEIVQGESKNIEFKITLPEKSEKYTKTIIAFANTQGGRLIIGIDVVISVTPGPNRPYYLKARGKENGTYIRVAGTTRPAHLEKIKELEMEGARISWDELVCVGYEVKEKAIKGTGIRRIREAARDYKLPAPEFLAFDDMFRVNLYRSLSSTIREGDGDLIERFGESSEKNDLKRSMMQKNILDLIRKNNRISAKVMAEALSVSSRTVEKNIKILREQGVLIRHGSARNGYWEIVDVVY